MPFPPPDHFISTRMVDPALRLLRIRDDGGAAPRRLPVLMYHSITDDAEPGVRGYYRLNTPPALFREHLKVIRDEGFTAVGLSTAYSEWSTEFASSPAASPRRKLVAVTFDDGYRDFDTAAWPALADLGFNATVFLPTAFISRKRRAFKDRPCLTWDEVRDLGTRGVEFGSHTVNHPKLVELGAQELGQELKESRKAIEEELGMAVQTFAHPYAFPGHDRAYVFRFREAMVESGYHLGVTTALGCVQPGDDPLTLKRLPANGADDARLLRAKLHGAYDWLAVPQRAYKGLKSLVRG